MRLLESVQGVQRVRARSSDQRVDVQFDPGKVDEKAIEERLSGAGYQTRAATPTHSP